MSEIITTYLISNPDEAMPMDREDFYREQIVEFKTNGKPTRAAEVVQIILFTPDKEIIVQKRSQEKFHNAGLVDKTIGGHVTFGDKPTYTVMTETLQELNVPSIALNDNDDFKKTYRLLRKFLTNSALVQYIETRLTNLEKVFASDDKVLIANKYHLYFGVYAGSIKPIEKEATGITYYKLDNLLSEIERTPQNFTYDLKYLLKKYSGKINDFLKQLD